ncbi:phenylacetaldehyde oxime monooxygenase CYP71AN24-like [Humulus lupulus]|uniref:phenylacetaldehyde oxime monooxygenase CYP71AN24-like n=1 Tax=Humulus lupulus TaxID=3486 RepID=UPI002B40D46E|nr:phenylacetaldehyde oxime monooxygenase CYP71AN24-like [Humulus lupulus]
MEIKNYAWQSDPLLLSLYLLLLPLLLILLLFKRNRSWPTRQLNLPPSPPSFPIIGNLHQLTKDPHRSLRALSNKYGPLMLLHLGQVPTLIVSSPDLVEEIVNTSDVAFSGRPNTTATEFLFYGHKNVLFAPYGEYWRQARKICVLELLSLKRVQSFQIVREQEVNELINEIRKEGCVDGGLSINLSKMLIQASNNVMSRCVLGHSYKTEDGSIRKLEELSRDMSMQLMAFSFGDFFPCLRWIDVLRGFVGRLRSSFRDFDSFNDRAVQEHKAARKCNHRDGSEMEDFVDVLLRLQHDSELEFELTQDHIKAILQDMLAAGNDTTSTVAEWLLAELVRNPRVMKKAQEEVRRVVGEKAKVEINDINQMNYLKCVVKENLRLHPPAPLLAPRETTTRVQLGGYDVPARTRVMVNAWAIHRDPSLWGKPDEFIPERFENNRIDFNGQDFKFIPSGFGRRRCPGLAFGIISIEYMIANLLYWFDWKMPDESGLAEFDMSEVCGLTVHKNVPLHIVPISYSP